MVAQQLERERDLIAEVDDAVLLLHAGVGLERRGELLVHRGLVRLHIGVQRISCGLAHRARMRDVRLRRYVLVARAAEELEECPNVRERISRRPVSLERERDVAGRAAVEVLPHENDLLSGRQDPKLAGTSELESELAEHLVAEAVKRTDDRIVQADRGVDVDPLLHLRCGSLGEGHGQNLVRLGDARADEMDDPRGEHVGLPRSGAGYDEKRAFAVIDRAPLLGRQAGEDVGLRLTKPEAELLGHR